MKKTKISFKILLIVSIFFFLAGCAVYKPTPIVTTDMSIKDGIINKKLHVKCGYYSLKKVDKLEGATKTSFNRDQQIAINEVNEKLKELCKERQECMAKVSISQEGDTTLTKYFADFKIYQYVNWAPVVVQILPTYYAVNSSLCVTADLYKSEGKELVKNYTEWGYIKESGFWIIDFGDKPNSKVLRGQLVRNVLKQLVDDINNLNE